MISDLGKLLLFMGLLLAGLGVLLLFADRLPGIGRLPGDILIQRKNFTFYFPITTSILISILLSVLLWFFLGRRG